MAKSTKVSDILKSVLQNKKVLICTVVIILVFIVLFAILNKFVFKPIQYERNFERFKVIYEEKLQDIKEKYSLDIDRIEYSELVPDYDLDYWETERINVISLIFIATSRFF